MVVVESVGKEKVRGPEQSLSTPSGPFCRSQAIPSCALTRQAGRLGTPSTRIKHWPQEPASRTVRGAVVLDRAGEGGDARAQERRRNGVAFLRLDVPARRARCASRTTKWRPFCRRA